jgi:EAL domain-containing protein (putative c-di-GMP-specific phosphodiesterase class I)
MQIKHLYQPVYNLVTKQIVGHEALLRGPNDEGPAEVLDAAARCGRLRETDALSFSMAVAGAPSGIAFVNILPETLVWLVSQGIGITKYAGRQTTGEICVEIVEMSALSSVFPRFMQAIEVVRASGFKLAVDDVSSGSDRLRLIAELEPDYIKIDRYLVAECDRHPNRLHTIHRLLQLAGDLGAAVIAEGIERQEELSVLIDIGVIYGQGFLLGRPMEMERCVDAK